MWTVVGGRGGRWPSKSKWINWTFEYPPMKPLIEADAERHEREGKLLSAFAATFQTHSPPLPSDTTAGGARTLSGLAQAGLNGRLAGGKFRSLFWKVCEHVS